MADGKTKTVTVAPKNPAKAIFSVINVTTRAALKGAHVKVQGKTEEGKDVLVEEDSNHVGRVERIFEAGTYDTSVMLDAFGPAPDSKKPDQLPPPPPWRDPALIYRPINEASPDKKKPAKPFTNNVAINLVQVQPRVLLKVVDPSRSKGAVMEHVMGVEVTIAGQTGVTDVHGAWTSKGIPIGKHEITLRKNGYGPPPSGPLTEGAALAEGEVKTIVDFSKPVDTNVILELQNIWGFVHSHDITVGGVNFVEWYNGTFHPTFKGDADLPKIKKPTAFNDTFDKCERFWEHELPVEVFVGLFLIFTNETGGTYAPGIPEAGSPKYFFEPLKREKPPLDKASYNGGGNRLAGNLLLKRGVLKEPDDKDAIVAWNKPTPYPNPPAGSPLEAAARECDFYKYKGRGLVQVTHYDAYIKTVHPHLRDKGYVSAALSPEDAMDSISTAKMEEAIQNDPDVFFPMVRDYLRDKSVAGMVHGLNVQEWWKMGKRVSGGSLYATRYEERCKALYSAMIKAKFVLK